MPPVGKPSKRRNRNERHHLQGQSTTHHRHRAPGKHPRQRDPPHQPRLRREGATDIHNPGHLRSHELKSALPHGGPFLFRLRRTAVRRSPERRATFTFSPPIHPFGKALCNGPSLSFFSAATPIRRNGNPSFAPRPSSSTLLPDNTPTPRRAAGGPPSKRHTCKEECT